MLFRYRGEWSTTACGRECEFATEPDSRLSRKCLVSQRPLSAHGNERSPPLCGHLPPVTQA